MTVRDRVGAWVRRAGVPAAAAAFGLVAGWGLGTLHRTGAPLVAHPPAPPPPIGIVRPRQAFPAIQVVGANGRPAVLHPPATDVVQVWLAPDSLLGAWMTERVLPAIVKQWPKVTVQVIDAAPQATAVAVVPPTATMGQGRTIPVADPWQAFRARYARPGEQWYRLTTSQAREARIAMLPTLVWIDPNGQVQAVVPGALSLTAMRQIAQALGWSVPSGASVPSVRSSISSVPQH